jgi:hypothetical protein
MQGSRAEFDKSFIILSGITGLHHQTIRSNTDNAGLTPNLELWRDWDLTINVTDLRLALRSAMRNLRGLGFVLNATDSDALV